jgi:cell wall-associated NlpC family hydrolase
VSLVACPLSIVPVRKEPSDRAEMVSQWLFGETADLLERQEKWSLLRFHHDGYQGWVDNKQLRATDITAAASAVRSIDAFMSVATDKGPLLLPFGAVLDSFAQGQFTLHGAQVAFTGNTTRTLTGTPVERLLALTDRWLNAPYLWGGRTPAGVDCSGLTQMLFMAAGMMLPRDAWQQAELGSNVELVDLAEPGDLAFFDNAEGRIVHVGIVLPEGRILHASGHVRIDTLDHQGIFNAQNGTYSHQLRMLKRLV